MRNLKILILPIYFLTSVLNINGQCIADAGPDKVICTNLGNPDTVTLGGNPTGQSSYPPFTYSWKATYSILNFTLTEKDFLDSSTISNPTIIYHPFTEIIFFLTVKDSNGNLCYDTAKVKVSDFAATLEDKQRMIEQGDSLIIYPGINGGIEPVSYHWTPQNFLKNPFSGSTWAKPDTTTFYRVSITDSAGCKAEDPDIFEVIVYPLGVNEKIENLKVNIFPNPVQESSTLEINGLISSNTSIIFYNSNGQQIREIRIKEPKTEISWANYQSGVYNFKLLEKGQIILKGLLIKK